MQTTIFERWKRDGRTLAELAERLNYSREYIYRVAAGDLPVTESFMARCVLHIGEEARDLFFSDAPVAHQNAL